MTSFLNENGLIRLLTRALGCLRQHDYKGERGFKLKR